jgi:hypothetical protein
MNCPKCNNKLIPSAIAETLVGYFSPPGHNHNDNCLTRAYRCTCGYSIIISKRRTCPVCSWKGKETCFCHPGKKVDEWPE